MNTLENTSCHGNAEKNMRPTKGDVTHRHELKRLNRIRGQIEAVQRMIAEGRYCPDILVQIKAARAALQSLERSILETHLHGCVESALSSRDENVVREKIDELVQLLKNH